MKGSFLWTRLHGLISDFYFGHLLHGLRCRLARLFEGLVLTCLFTGLLDLLWEGEESLDPLAALLLRLLSELRFADGVSFL